MIPPGIIFSIVYYPAMFLSAWKLRWPERIGQFIIDKIDDRNFKKGHGL